MRKNFIASHYFKIGLCFRLKESALSLQLELSDKTLIALLLAIARVIL